MRSPLDRIRHHIDRIAQELAKDGSLDRVANLDAIEARADAIRVAVEDERASRRGRVATAAPPAAFPVPRE